MRRIENHCVNCQIPCMGVGCKYLNVEVCYCDRCGNYAKYILDGFELCNSCADKYLDEVFKTYSVDEKANMIDIEIEELE